MHPAERVRFVTETARAVLAGRLDADEAATALALQAEQLTGLLRSDRNDVTRSECDTVATQLRLLAEQIADTDSSAATVDARRAIADTIGTLAQSLR